MRVKRPSLSIRLRSETDGATAVIFAICLLTLFSVAALAVDAGQLWWNRRSLVVDTDAAALAAAGHAREVMDSTGSCDVPGAGAEADLVVAGNSTTTDFDPTDPTDFSLACVAGSRYGHVTVTATDVTNYAFAGLFRSAQSLDVVAQSHAEFGPLVAADHLRPLPLCIDPSNDTAYGDWKINKGSSSTVYLGTTPQGTHYYKVPVDQTTFNAICNPQGWSSSGNFLWIDFDGSGGSTPCPDESNGGGANEAKDRFVSAYPCYVYTTQYSDGGNVGPNCRPDSGGWAPENCPSNTGNVTSIIHCVRGQGGGCHDQRCPMTTAAAACDDQWTLLIYDQLVGVHPSTGATCTPGGPGSNACQIHFRPVGFVVAVLRVAEQGGPGNPNYFGLEFRHDATNQGVIGGPGTNVTHLNVSGVRLCGAEYADNCKG